VIDFATFIIHTARTQLRIPGPDEAEAVLRYHVENRAHLEPWEPPKPAPYYTVEVTQRRLAMGRADAAEDRGYRFYIFDASGSRVIGGSNLSVIVHGPLESCFLGYSLAEAEQGKGLMREAVAATIDFAWDHLKLHRIEAGYAPHNVRSARLLRSLGFVVEGYCRDYIFTGGVWTDNIRTALHNPRFPADWRPSPARP
jgi:[ribosomal protein S5]-alanine N-acetyltransferase